MKGRFLLGCLAAGIVLPAGGRAQEPAAEMVEFEVRFVEASKDQAAELFNPATRVSSPRNQIGTPTIPTDLGPGIPLFPPDTLVLSGIFSPEQLTATLARLKKAGAEIASVPRVVTVSGRRATVQNVREFRYPSEFSKPDAAGKVVPITFEMTPIGTVLEFEPKTGPEGAIDLTVGVSLKELSSYADYTAKQDPNQKTPEPYGGSPVWLPVTKTRQLTTTVTVWSGQTLLLNTDWQNGNNRVQLIFITTREVSSQ